jgi:sec-independent protein translocase protein TatB
MVAPPPIEVASLGMADSLILMVLALVVFGPRRLPQIGRQIGKLMYEFRKASNDFKFQMEEELRSAEEADRRKKEEAERQRVAALASASQASVSAPAPTVEAQADVGAVEPPTAGSGYPEGYPPETAASGSEPAALSEPAPVIQPPQTGEQVSASRPDYHFESSGSEQAIAAEVNPEADAEANAAGVEARDGANVEESADPSAANGRSGGSVTNPEPPTPPNHPNDQDLSAGTSSKEPVSQHG